MTGCEREPGWGSAGLGGGLLGAGLLLTLLRGSGKQCCKGELVPSRKMGRGHWGEWGHGGEGGGQGARPGARLKGAGAWSLAGGQVLAMAGSSMQPLPSPSCGQGAGPRHPPQPPNTW